ncbi:MAG: hypothetical protein AAGU27_18295 [Dehalobacterium sp.]
MRDDKTDGCKNRKPIFFVLCLLVVFLTNRLAGIPLCEFCTLLTILSVIGTQIIILQAFLYHHGTIMGQIFVSRFTWKVLY